MLRGCKGEVEGALKPPQKAGFTQSLERSCCLRATHGNIVILLCPMGSRVPSELSLGDTDPFGQAMVTSLESKVGGRCVHDLYITHLLKLLGHLWWHA